jgi:hypothetical protein
MNEQLEIDLWQCFHEMSSIEGSEILSRLCQSRSKIPIYFDVLRIKECLDSLFKIVRQTVQLINIETLK